MQDEQIIERMISGDQEAFGLLYDRYVDKIYNFVYYRVRRRQEAEDLVSQTFFKALSKVGGFSSQKGSFKAWLYSIARNSIIDHYRRLKPESGLEDIYDLCDDKDLTKEVGARMKLEEVDRYLSGLKKEQRELVIMRVWEGLSYAEIAEITGKSEDSLKMGFSRTIKQLRKNMPLAVFISFILNI